MSHYFIDASALVKRYAREPGRSWLSSVTDPSGSQSCIVAEISLAEVAAALAAKQREPGGISPTERERAVGRFLQDSGDHFLLFPAARDVIDLAVVLTQRHRLRGCDAVQLAAALLANRDLTDQDQPPLVFVASDNDLLAAAQAEGLSTENPLDHVNMDQVER